LAKPVANLEQLSKLAIGSRFVLGCIGELVASPAGDMRSGAAGSTFTTAEIYPHVIKALGCAPKEFTFASLRYDLSKLRAKGLIAKLPRSRRYQLLPCGYSICLVFLKLFERIYAPLAAAILSPIKSDVHLRPDKRSQLDRLYQRVVDDLNHLVHAVGLKKAA
jgi:hypothetical protein